MFDFLNISLVELLLLSVLVSVFLVQMVYWFRYMGLLHHISCSNTIHDGRQVPPVSVIVVVNRSHEEWIKGDMGELFNQDHTDYEVIVVNDCGGEEVSSLLQMMCVRYPIMKYTEIIPDRKFSHTTKVAKLLGIKSAKYENLLFVEPWSCPSSSKWLTEMASCYVSDSDVVLGMSLPKKENKWWNGFARSFSMISLIRSSVDAIYKRPYWASRSNFGFTKGVFFSTGGYNYLTTGYGDNDLYLRKIAKRKNSFLALSRECLMLISLPDTFGRWFEDLRFSTAMFKHYRKGVKLKTFIYLLSLLLFWILLAISVLSVEWNSLLLYILAVCIFLRQVTVYCIYAAISRKLGFKGLLGGFIIYDILMPFFELFLSISRNIGAPSRY